MHRPFVSSPAPAVPPPACLNPKQPCCRRLPPRSYQYLTLLHFLDRGEWPHPTGNQPGQPSVTNEHEWPRCVGESFIVWRRVANTGNTAPIPPCSAGVPPLHPAKLPVPRAFALHACSWNAFLRGTSRLFGGRELCDCYREDLFQVSVLG